MKPLLIAVVIGLSLLSFTISHDAYADGKIPSWVKNIFVWYGEGKTSENDLIGAIKFLVEHGIIQLDTTSQPSNTNPTTSSNSNPTPQSNSGTTSNGPTNLSKIDQFYITGNSADDKYTARFSLMDNNLQEIASDGTVSLSITDSANNNLYQKTFSIKQNDFRTYSLLLTGQNVLAYVWSIPTSDVMKGTGGFGTAKLTFTTNNGKTYSTTDSTVSIPTYTDAELSQLNEQAYSKSATVVNQQLSQGNFQVTVTKVGFFTTSSFGTPQSNFRVDMQVKNIGTATDTLSLNALAILDSQGNQYENQYGGTLDLFSQIYPGVVKNGYILFKPIPNSSQNIKLAFQLGYDENYKPYTFQYDISLIK